MRLYLSLIHILFLGCGVFTFLRRQFRVFILKLLACNKRDLLRQKPLKRRKRIGQNILRFAQRAHDRPDGVLDRLHGALLACDHLFPIPLAVSYTHLDDFRARLHRLRLVCECLPGQARQQGARDEEARHAACTAGNLRLRPVPAGQAGSEREVQGDNGQGQPVQTAAA